MSHRLLIVLFLATLNVASVVAHAASASLVLSSGTERTTVIELYTSEGCSSCPPAERWLSMLEDHPGLWQQVIPLAFHVDYWDYIGWPDRFAREEFGQRQRRYAIEAGARSVYTPGMFRNGEEWLAWRRNASATSSDSHDVGELELTLEGETVSLSFAASDRSLSELEGHVAVLGMGLETNVRAGENAGRTLRHDFVVLEVRSVDLEHSAGDFMGTTRLPRAAEEAKRTAVVAWVSEPGSAAPVQAVGGYLR